MKDQFLINIIKDSGVMKAKGAKQVREAWLVLEELLKRNGKVLYQTYKDKTAIYAAIDTYLIMDETPPAVDPASTVGKTHIADNTHDETTTAVGSEEPRTDEEIIADTESLMRSILDPIVDTLKKDETSTEEATEEVKEEAKASSASTGGGSDNSGGDDTSYLGWILAGVAVLGAGYVAYNYFGSDSDVTLVDMGQQEGVAGMGI